MRIALATAVLVGGSAALAAARLTANDDPWASLAFVALAIAAGFVGRRWRVVGLAVLLVPAAAVAHDHDSGVAGSVILTALVTVPVAAASLALGVWLGLQLERRRRTSLG